MNFLRKIWAVYGIVLFFLLWVVLMPFYIIAFLVFPKSWTRYIIWFSHHVYTRVFFALTLIRFDIQGLEKLDRNQTYVIVSNHLTTLDFMINALAFPGVYKYLAKAELTKVPIFGRIVKNLCVLVDRKDKASRSKSIVDMQEALEHGYSIFLYPEGTRNNSSDPLLPFHKGAFMMAINTGHPIAVQTLVKIKHISKVNKGLDYWPGKVKVVWSEPISVEGMTIKDVRTVSEKVSNIMKEQLENHRT
ncbi:MAG: lysophospholipid acyltransferase family protein [Bacteroidota bacterium]